MRGEEQSRLNYSPERHYKKVALELDFNQTFIRICCWSFSQIRMSVRKERLGTQNSE